MTVITIDTDEFRILPTRPKPNLIWMRLLSNIQPGKSIYLSQQATFALRFSPQVTVSVHPTKPYIMICEASNDHPNKLVMAGYQKRLIYSAAVWDELVDRGVTPEVRYIGVKHPVGLIFRFDGGEIASTLSGSAQ